MNLNVIVLVASLSTVLACHTEGPATSTAATTAPVTTAATPGPAIPVTARHDKPFKDLIAGAQVLKINASEPKRKSVEVTSAKDISAVVDALGPAQTSTDGAPRCTTPFSLVFLDGAGKTLAQVDLCDSAGLAESNKPQGRLSEPKEQAGGFTVANLGALRATLKPSGVDLP